MHHLKATGTCCGVRDWRSQWKSTTLTLGLGTAFWGLRLVRGELDALQIKTGNGKILEFKGRQRVGKVVRCRKNLRNNTSCRKCACNCCPKHSVKTLVKPGFHKALSFFFAFCAREEDGRTKVLYVCAGCVLGDGDVFIGHSPMHRPGSVILCQRYSLVPLKDNPYKVHFVCFVGRNICLRIEKIPKSKMLKDAKWWNLETLKSSIALQVSDVLYSKYPDERVQRDMHGIYL